MICLQCFLSSVKTIYFRQISSLNWCFFISDTQASSDTLTDLLNPSDLSSSRTSNTITTTTSSNEFLNPDEDKKQQSNNKSRTESCNLETKCAQYNFWMAQVEMNTHASPHRRLWMGPQFTFKTIMDKRKQEAARGSCMDPNESHNSDHNGEQPANLEVTHSFVGDTCMSASTTVEAERVDNETDVPTGCVDMFRALPFQSVDKMDLDVLRSDLYLYRYKSVIETTKCKLLKKGC